MKSSQIVKKRYKYLNNNQSHENTYIDKSILCHF